MQVSVYGPKRTVQAARRHTYTVRINTSSALNLQNFVAAVAMLKILLSICQIHNVCILNNIGYHCR